MPAVEQNRIVHILSFLFLLMLVASCDYLGGSDEEERFFQGTWLLPEEEIRDGGTWLDGIPSIEDPDFGPASENNYVTDDRMVIGVKIDGRPRAYPHQILDWHEIVNDRIGDHVFAVTFCPLTGTGMVWNRIIHGRETEFGVSGLLFRNNLIAYDRRSENAWSQMQLRSVIGDLAGTNVETYPVIETTWETWRMLYPDSDLLTTNTGFSRNYRSFAYGSDYATDHSRISFPLSNPDNRLQNKERVLGVIDSPVADLDATVKAFVIGDFGNGVNLIEDRVGDRDYLIIGSTEYNFAAAFIQTGDYLALEYEAVHDQLPIVMQDNEGNLWDIFGFASEGPRAGDRLPHARSYVGYWFAFAEFFPGLDIYGQ